MSCRLQSLIPSGFVNAVNLPPIRTSAISSGTFARARLVMAVRKSSRQVPEKLLFALTSNILRRFSCPMSRETRVRMLGLLLATPSQQLEVVLPGEVGAWPLPWGRIQVHPKPLSSKTSFIQNHFHPNTTFIPDPVSSKNDFDARTTANKTTGGGKNNRRSKGGSSGFRVQVWGVLGVVGVVGVVGLWGLGFVVVVVLVLGVGCWCGCWFWTLRFPIAGNPPDPHCAGPLRAGPQSRTPCSPRTPRACAQRSIAR